ncbi:MAG TPA: DUF3566 domain-containing protein, partial [Micromonosporaceae bacterium]|nr:DUF3566 domain-containing protein [Micromonosporaceae bacterium]
MTETQATSGTAGASTNRVDEEAAADGGAPKTARAAVGRATVPADRPSPKFTRAPGMSPPPEQPRSGQDGQAGTAASKGATVARPASAPPAAAAAAATRTATAPGLGRPPAGRTGTTAGRPWRNAAVGAARVTEAVRAAKSTVNSAASRGPRRARLNIKRIDPWSVMKFAAAVSVVLFIVV